jgi:molecular chaperone HtpG
MKDILGDKVEKVLVSDRVVDSPCVLVTGEYGWSANMERIMKAQALRDNSMSGVHGVQEDDGDQPRQRHHGQAPQARRRRQERQDRQGFGLVDVRDRHLHLWLLSLEEPNTFGGRIHRMIKLGLSIDDDLGLDDEDDLPPLEEDVDEGSRMEEVD